MSTVVGAAIIDLKADTSKLVAGMDRAERTLKKSINNIKSAIVSMAAAYAGIQGVKAFKNMIDDSLDAADATGKLAQKLGLSVESLSKYQYAAKFSAISIGELNAGLSALVRRLNNFQRDGGGAAKKAFEVLGISADYAREHFTSTDIAFKEILKRLEKMPDGFKKTAIAQDIFSKSASSILRLTASDLKKFGDEAQRIGLSISQSTYQMAADYHDTMDRISARIEGMQRSISFGVIKPMDAASRAGLKMVDDIFGKTTEDKMKNYESMAVTAIGNVVYSIGFIKDAFTGVELVIKGLEIAFYSMATVIGVAMEPSILLINTMIEGYNYIADKLGKDTIDYKLVSSVPDNIKKVKELSNEFTNLTDELENGRITADEFMQNFKQIMRTLDNNSSKTSVKGAIDGAFKGFNAGASEAKEAQKDILKQLKAISPSITAQYETQSKINEKLNDRKLIGVELGKRELELIKSSNAYNTALENQKLNEKKINDLKKEELKIEELIKKAQKDGINADKLEDALIKNRNNQVKARANYEKSVNTVLQTRYDYSEAYLRENGNMLDGFMDSYNDYVMNMPNAFENGVDLMKATIDSLDRSFMDFFDSQSDAFMDFGKLGKSILRDIEKELIRTQVVQPITSATSSVIGSVTSSVVDAVFDGWDDGGYTYKSTSDKTPVGVVHANEYVIPAWMVRKHPSLVQGLEAERRGLRGFGTGGRAGASGGTNDSASAGGGSSSSSSSDNGGWGGDDGHDGGFFGSHGDSSHWSYVSDTPTYSKPAPKPQPLPATSFKQMEKMLGLYDTRTAFEKAYDKSIDAIDNTLGTAIKGLFSFGGALLGSPLGGIGAAFGGKLGGKLADTLEISDLNWSDLIDIDFSSYDMPNMQNTMQTTSQTNSILGDIFSKDNGEDFSYKIGGYTITKNSTANDIRDIIINKGFKKDVIDATKDIWKSMIDYIPEVKEDATGNWTKLFNDYIEKGNEALLKATLDGSIFETPDFYKSWETYAKSLNDSVNEVLKNSLGELEEFKYNYTTFLLKDTPDELVKYEFDYYQNIAEKMANSIGVDFATLTKTNFLEKMDNAIAKDFTPKTLSNWEKLGDALKTAYEYEEKYLETIENGTIAHSDMLLPKMADGSNTDIQSLKDELKADNEETRVLFYEILKELKTQTSISQGLEP